MTQMTDQYAIALEHARIALFKRRDDLHWDIVDSVDVDGQDESKIGSILAPFAKEWRKKTEAVSVCLPSDVVIFSEYDHAIDKDEILEKHADISAETHHIAIKAEPKAAFAAFEIEHIELTKKFLEDFGFTILAIGHSDVGLNSSSPTFFDIEQFGKSHVPISVSPQLELDLEAKPASEQVIDEVEEVPAEMVIAEPTSAKAFPVKFTAVALAILIALAAAWWFASTQEKTPDAIPAEEPAVESTIETPNETPSDLQIEELPEVVAPVQPDAPSTSTAIDQEPHAQQLGLEQPLVLVQKPEFTVVPRPEAHALYVENFPESALLVVLQEAPAMVRPLARPATLNIPPPPPALSLIGISGAAGKPGALIQTAGGQFKRVNVGDTVDGWKIQAISKKEVIIASSGLKETLTVPTE